jgi:hypothetical protein
VRQDEPYNPIQASRAIYDGDDAPTSCGERVDSLVSRIPIADSNRASHHEIAVAPLSPTLLLARKGPSADDAPRGHSPLWRALSRTWLRIRA